MKCPDCKGTLTETRRRNLANLVVSYLSLYTLRCRKCKKKVTRLSLEPATFTVGGVLRRTQ